MTDEQKMQAFAQKVIVTMTGKRMDIEDLESEDGDRFIEELVDATNMAVDELEVETDWNFVTDIDKLIGSVSTAADTFPLPAGARKLSVREHRPLHITQDGTPVSTWDVVRPRDISTTRTGYPLRDRVTYVGKKIIFSRPLNDNELGGEVVADVVNYIPRLVYVKGQAEASNNLDVLELIEPTKLLVLGIAKDLTLPDFVRGKISPSLSEKYADLLGKVVAENDTTATGDTYEGDDLSSLGGGY